MKFTSSFLAIALAIGHVAATPINDAAPPNITFTYWPQPGFQGVPVPVSVYPGICTQNPKPLPIRSLQLRVGACTLFISPGCTGPPFTVAAPGSPSIPPPFSGNVSSFGCKY